MKTKNKFDTKFIKIRYNDVSEEKKVMPMFIGAAAKFAADFLSNIVNGVELIKRHLGKQSFGLTTPLITLASGTKMGKTEKGAIWLNKKMLSPYDYWQFWRNTDDKDVIKFLKLSFFSELRVNSESSSIFLLAIS